MGRAMVNGPPAVNAKEAEHRFVALLHRNALDMAHWMACTVYLAFVDDLYYKLVRVWEVDELPSDAHLICVADADGLLDTIECPVDEYLTGVGYND